MTSTVRVVVLGALFAVLLAVLVLRLWTMQVTGVHAYEERAASQQVRVVTTPAPRGDIVDANGVKLAGTRSALAAVVDLALVDDDEQQSLAEKLGAFLDEPASAILEQLSGDNRGAQITVAKDLSDSQATFLLEHKEEFPGVSVIPQPIRTYPLGDLAAHVLGHIGRPDDQDLEREDIERTDVVGKAGLEKSYDEQLQGSRGIVQYRVDAKRKVLSLVGESAPTAGRNLVLNIDAGVQQQVQDSLRDGLLLARKLEMEERANELTHKSRAERLSEALAEARSEVDPEPDEPRKGTAELGVDDDDVPRELEPVTVDPIDVLGPLYPGLPIDGVGVCVPVQRVSVPLGAEGVLSGFEPQFIRLESVVEVDGEFEATVSLSGERTSVRVNQYVDGAHQILQVLHITEEEVVLLHKDPWCPVRATSVVINPNDGSVIAMSSFPTYDPTVFVDGLSNEQWARLGTVGALQNFAVQGQYAPASTFKVVAYVFALEESYYPIDRGLGDKEVGAAPEGDDAPEQVPLLSDTAEYSCTGEFRFKLGDGSVQVKRDWKWPGGHGPLDLHGALEGSCNLYFWDLALRLWQDRHDNTDLDTENVLQQYARSFGFGAATGVDLPFEKDGLIPDRSWFSEEQSKGTGRVRADGPWVGGDLMDIAVGEGATLATPLQVANAFAAMVNGGTVWQPRVVSHIVDGDGEILDVNLPIAISEADISPRTVRLLREALQQVVNNPDRGTAYAAFRSFGENVELVGGKTGTGEVISAPATERFRQASNAWFVGVAPMNDPEWVVSVVVERGGSGGRIAAPVARQILQYLLNGADGVTELVPGLDAD